jgi:hypothetical protein
MYLFNFNVFGFLLMVFYSGTFCIVLQQEAISYTGKKIVRKYPIK